MTDFKTGAGVIKICRLSKTSLQKFGSIGPIIYKFIILTLLDRVGSRRKY